MYQQLSQEYQVWEASNGEEAETIANEKEVDIVVSDVMMPYRRREYIGRL